MTRYNVCNSSEILDGTTKLFKIDKTEVLIGRVEGRLFACNNSCPHRGASLALGNLNAQNIVCYMHGYEYNVFDGQLVKMKSWKKEDTWVEQSPGWRHSGNLDLYKVTEQNGQINIEL